MGRPVRALAFGAAKGKAQEGAFDGWNSATLQTNAWQHKSSPEACFFILCSSPPLPSSIHAPAVAGPPAAGAALDALADRGPAARALPLVGRGMPQGCLHFGPAARRRLQRRPALAIHRRQRGAQAHQQQRRFCVVGGVVQRAMAGCGCGVQDCPRRHQRPHHCCRPRWMADLERRPVERRDAILSHSLDIRPRRQQRLDCGHRCFGAPIVECIHQWSGSSSLADESHSPAWHPMKCPRRISIDAAVDITTCCHQSLDGGGGSSRHGIKNRKEKRRGTAAVPVGLHVRARRHQSRDG